jgi:hypothetical protein
VQHRFDTSLSGPEHLFFAGVFVQFRVYFYFLFPKVPGSVPVHCFAILSKSGVSIQNSLIVIRIEEERATRVSAYWCFLRFVFWEWKEEF